MLSLILGHDHDLQMDDLPPPDLPEPISGSFPSPVLSNGMYESTVFGLNSVTFFNPKARQKGAFASTAWSSERRKTPENCFRNVRGNEAVHMKSYCHDYIRSGEHCFGVEAISVFEVIFEETLLSHVHWMMF